MAGRLVLIVGLPGSGKTTMARLLEGAYPGFRLSADDWMVTLQIDLYDAEARARIEQLQWELAQRLLSLDQTVVIEWGTWGKAERDALRVRARELSAAVELRYLTAPLDVLWERVCDRGMEAKFGSHSLTLDDMRGYEAAFEAPDEAERTLFDPSDVCL